MRLELKNAILEELDDLIDLCEEYYNSSMLSDTLFLDARFPKHFRQILNFCKEALQIEITVPPDERLAVTGLLQLMVITTLTTPNITLFHKRAEECKGMFECF